jgi:hypothetical protein
LLMVEGRQYPFLMEGLWRSEVPAKPGVVVNVDFDTQGNLNSITAIAESKLGQEQAEVALAASGVRRAGSESWAFGTGTLARLAAAVLLMLSWCFLTAVSIHLPLFGNLDLTFWQVLGYVNAGNFPQISEVPGNPDSGVFGFLAILVLAGPFLHYFWKDRRTLLGGLLPLGFMVRVAYMIRGNIHSSMAAQLIGAYEPAQTKLHDGIFNAISVGLGTYLSVSLAIYFAALSAKQFMAASGAPEKKLERFQKMAA